MASPTIPPSIELLQIVSQSIGEWIDWVQPDSEDFSQVAAGINGPLTPEYVVILQTLLVATLTMFEGVGTPSITGISTTDETVTIRWTAGASDTITWGENDAAFFRFSNYVATKVLQLPPTRNKNALPSGILSAIATRLEYYISALTVTENRVSALINADIAKTFNGKIDPVFLFVVLGCLPHDQLNSMFLHIQQFLPDDLVIRNASGQPVVVNQLFQPAADIRFMVEKTNLYLELFTHPEMPIIREITQAKTISYFQKLMKTPGAKEGVIENLKNIILYQISPRTQLYTLILRIINQIKRHS